MTRSVVGVRLVHNETTGAYDDINDEISELGFFSESRDTPGMVERNPIQTLAFLRFILKGAADMSVALGKPEEQRRGLWRRIAAGLQNYVSVLAMSPEDSASHIICTADPCHVCLLRQTVEALPLPEPDGPATPVYSCGTSGPIYYRTVHALAP